MEPSFSGYVTKADLKCADGRTIKRGAFAHQDGLKVPLVYQHNHDDISQVLGHVILKKEEDGSLEAFELSDLDPSEVGELRSYESELAMLLSEDDVTAVAAAVEPGTSAAVLVWENAWAAPFASAVRRSGGQLVASGRIPVQAMLAAIEADDEAEGAE